MAKVLLVFILIFSFYVFFNLNTAGKNEVYRVVGEIPLKIIQVSDNVSTAFQQRLAQQ